jgi:hypothetical protein
MSGGGRYMNGGQGEEWRGEEIYMEEEGMSEGEDI